MTVTTEEQKVVIFSDDYRIEGTIYLHFQQRLLDFINVIDENKVFFPMTKVNIYSSKNNKLINTLDFISISRKKITLIFSQVKK
ncbi:hypothetical protein KAI68_07945 [bacterium]|nr:hypothetical protein [bacterium]